jgi:hypothetical protein
MWSTLIAALTAVRLADIGVVCVLNGAGTAMNVAMGY